MILDFDKLFEPYTADGHTIENTVRYLRKTASTMGVSPFLVDIAVREVFAEIAAGKVFPKDKCPCGCGINKAGTAVVHAMRDRMLKLDQEQRFYERLYTEVQHNKATLKNAEIGLEEAGRFISESIEREKARAQKVGLWQRIKDGLLRRSKPGSIPDSNAD